MSHFVTHDALLSPLDLVNDIPSVSRREPDVAAIDVNMGCPKEYSTKVSSCQDPPVALTIAL